MAAIDDLIQQIGDSALRERIAEEVGRLSKQKKFGLVFEEHLPECTPLYEVPVRRGALAARPGEMGRLFVVAEIADGVATCVEKGSGAKEKIPVAELSTVAAFGEPIYPYLKPLDCVENAPSSGLWHTLIEAENYHALQLLDYLYHGKVDCIYIDPPYNTGAKDWKYNNDYVDGSDQYRHSKWLSMMKKRLLLAKRLLNPKDSVLIVTIDEKEYLHLGCLLEEMFPEARIQMITSMTNKKGSTRVGIFSRRDEYIFFLFFGQAVIIRSNDDMISTDSKESKQKIIWNSLLRRGADGSSRKENPNLFYPFYISQQTGRIVDVGEPLEIATDRNTIIPPEGERIGWPIRSDGSEGRWQVSAENAKSMVKMGTMKAGRYNPKSSSYAINYLKKAQLEDLSAGRLIRTGTDETGAGIFEYKSDTIMQSEPGTIWVRESHDASIYGSTFLRAVLPQRKFPFPKSLYAVHDAIRFSVANKPNALILDFFAGSGTTLHAVNLLNAEDGGNRRCILVTNNEVSADEAKTLTNAGHKPGDEAWERLGIARYVTWPRTVCSIEGHDVNGAPLKGNYLGSDRPMAEGFAANAAFFHLGFLDKKAVERGTQLEKLLSLLWLKAGAIGKCPEARADDKLMVFPENRFAVLVNSQYAEEFRQELSGKQIEVAYIITDYESEYKSIAENLGVPTTYQLYRDYLDNFTINVGRE